MTSVIVDTNVVLSYLTDRDEHQQDQAALLFEAAGADTKLVVHQQVVTEMVYALVNHYDQARALVSSVVEEFLALPGVEIVDALRWSRVLVLWPETYRDFTDAVLADLASAYRSAPIATFDEAFSKCLERNEIPTWKFID